MHSKSKAAVQDSADPSPRHLLPRRDRGLQGRRSGALADAAGISAFFESEARAIRQGGSEHVFSMEYLNAFRLTSTPSSENRTLRLRHDLLGYWHAVRNGKQALLREAPCAGRVDHLGKRYDDLQKWCREIVWWGNKKGAHLCSTTATEITPELAGHY